MKLHILTTDTEARGREVTPFTEEGALYAHLFRYMATYAEICDIRPQDVPAMSDGDYSEAWGFLFPELHDQVFIDEIDISAKALPEEALTEALYEMRDRGAAVPFYDSCAIATMMDVEQTDDLDAWVAEERDDLEELMCDALRSYVVANAPIEDAACQYCGETAQDGSGTCITCGQPFDEDE